MVKQLCGIIQVMMGLVPCYMGFYFLSPTKFLTIWYFSTSLWIFYIFCLHDHLGSYNKSQLKTKSQICIMCCLLLKTILVFFWFLIIISLNSWFFENYVIFIFILAFKRLTWHISIKNQNLEFVVTWVLDGLFLFWF